MIFIGEASKLSGASIKAIRHYEQIGLLSDVSRSGSYRIFSENDINTIKLIKEAQNVGFKLSEFKQAFQENMQNLEQENVSWIEIEKLIREKESQISKEIERLKTKQTQLNQYSTLISECLKNDPDCSESVVDYMA